MKLGISEGKRGQVRPNPGWTEQRSAPIIIRTLMLVIVVGLLEAATRGGLIDPLLLPAPSRIFGRILVIVRSGEFVGDLTSTLSSMLGAFGIGGFFGLAVGVILWRIRFAGDVFEPYLATMYSMPTLVFYPILLAVFGLGPAPIIAIASTMALIPIALNTMVALRSINPILFKLGESLNCSRLALYSKIVVPAATPLVVPGLKLGFIYAVIGTIAMEFILAARGIGFRIGYLYRSFEIEDMYAYIVVVTLLSIAVNVGLNLGERRIRQDML